MKQKSLQLPPSIEAIIFDFDGVIVDTDPFNEHVWGEIFQKEGLVFNTKVYKSFFCGKTLRDGLTNYLAVYAPQENECLDYLIACKKSFDREYTQWIRPYQDVVDFINQTRERFKFAIASGARAVQINTAVEKFCWQDWFEVITTAEDYSAGKPNPEVYLLTLERLELNCEKAIAIEDSPSGVEAAQSAGIFCVAVTHTHNREDLQRADITLDHIILKESYSSSRRYLTNSD